jgi:HEAT repeat protein
MNRTRWLLGAVLALPACTRSVEEWREALRAEDPYERTLAVVALGRTADPAVVDDLFAALLDADEGVGLAARKALAGMGPAAVPRLLEGLTTDASRGEHGRQIAAMLLLEIGAPAVPPMIEALRDGSRSPRPPIAVMLGRLGDPAVLPLAALLSAEDPELAALAARGLAEAGSAGRPALPALLDLLERALAHEQVELSLAAARALVRMGPPDDRTLERVLVVLAAPAALSAPGRTTLMPLAVTGLLARLDAQPDERSARLEQLEALGPEAVAALAGLRAGDDARLADQAARAMQALAGP